jgi:hypothetical protein
MIWGLLRATAAKIASGTKTGVLRHDYLRESVVGVMPVVVEKLDISEMTGNCEDRKCPTKQKESFVGHPDATQFLRISGKRRRLAFTP